MKASKMFGFGFKCPSCLKSHVANSRLELVEAWEVGDVAKGFVLAKPLITEIYLYDGVDGDCRGLQEPEYHDAWQCGECGTVYLDMFEAGGCCK